MTIPIWLATVLVIALVSTVGYFIRLVLNLNDRVGRIESKLWPNGSKRAE